MNRQTSQRQSILVYQTRTDSLVERYEEFQAFFANCVRQVAHLAQDDRERRVCDDAIRGKRLSERGLFILIRIAARSPKQPFVLSDAIEQTTLAEIATPTACALEASREEQNANEPLNLAQLLAAEEDNPVRWVQVAELCGPQIHATKTLCAAAWGRAAKLS